MKKDVMGVIAFSVIGMVGALCASCSNGRDARKAERLMNEVSKQEQTIAELRDSLEQMQHPLDYMTIWGLDTNKKHKRYGELQMSLYEQGSQCYVGYGNKIVPVDRETYIYLKHANAEGVYSATIAECECGQWHATHQSDNE